MYRTRLGVAGRIRTSKREGDRPATGCDSRHLRRRGAV